jgi:hypothetical protein
MQEIDPGSKSKHLMIPEVGQQPIGPGMRLPLWFGVVLLIAAVLFIVWALGGSAATLPPQ